MIHLVDTITGAVPPDTIAAIASTLGEAPETTSRALGGVVPILLAAMVARVEHGGGGTMAALVTSALAAGNPLDGLGARLSDPMLRGAWLDGAGGFTAGLLGSQLNPITAAVSDHFGIKGQSSRGLLQLAGPLVAGGIGRALNSQPTAEGLADLLKSQRATIMSVLPPGMSGLLTPLTGTAAVAAANAHVGETLPESERTIVSRWLPWLLAAIAALALIFGLRSCDDERTLVTEAGTTPAVVTEAPVAPPPSAAVSAPVPAGSGIISETRAGLPALVVFFEVGKSDVSDELGAHIAPIQQYLTANPAAGLVVSGFNDPTGDAAANAELSKERAERVRDALVAQGIAPAAITLEKPADTTGDGATYAEARRVEVTIGQ